MLVRQIGLAVLLLGLSACDDATDGAGGATSASASNTTATSASTSTTTSGVSASSSTGSGFSLGPAPYDWVGVVGTGQSLSVGAAGTPVVSATQPFQNLQLHDEGPDPRYDGVNDALSLVPLVAPMRPNFPGYPATLYPNNIAGETPNEGMANQITALTKALGGYEHVTVATNVGESGQSITAIQKNGTGKAFASTLYEVGAIHSMASAQGKSYGVAAVILTHGETDWADQSYETEIAKLRTDYDADIKAITGQTDDVLLLVSQQSTFPPSSELSASTLAAWRLGVDDPAHFVCVGPKYQYAYAPDKVHFDAANYRRLGAKYAQVYAEIVLGKRAWAPLQPTKVALAGATLTVDFHVPNPPLAWEEGIAAPHQGSAAWANGRGFEVVDGSGAVAITDATIQGSSVVLTLAKTPGPDVVVLYAMIQDVAGFAGGTNDGRRGQLRDSDPFVGYDAFDVDVVATTGSATLTAAAPGAFAGRSIRTLVSPAGGGAATMIIGIAGDTLTLASPWQGPSGTTKVTIHDDQRNYAVQFALQVP